METKTIICGVCGQYFGVVENGTYKVVADDGILWGSIETKELGDFKCVQCGCNMKGNIREIESE